jgi:[ribosomal protein S5]-alanine N-acetyltransferase
MNFKLRQWEINDLQSLMKHANNWNVVKYMTEKFPFPYNEAAGKAYIDYAKTVNNATIFAIDVNGRAVGSIGVFLQEDVMRKNAELGYWLGEEYWGQGIITSVIKDVVIFAFANYDIDRVFARPFGINLASQRVLEKAGFTLEGEFETILFKNGEYFDELVYAIRR